MACSWSKGSCVSGALWSWEFPLLRLRKAGNIVGAGGKECLHPRAALQMSCVHFAEEHECLFYGGMRSRSRRTAGERVLLPRALFALLTVGTWNAFHLGILAHCINQPDSPHGCSCNLLTPNPWRDLWWDAWAGSPGEAGGGLGRPDFISQL